MYITGSLSDFSLLEILQFIGRGKKTGLLKISCLPENSEILAQRYYLWAYQGHIVAAAQQLDNQNLVSLIAQQNWVSDRVVAKLAQWCPSNQPLGLSLRSQGVLQPEQLQQLFQLQVIHAITTLLQLSEGQFRFRSNSPLPTQEMTGLSLLATEALLLGLRELKNWEALMEQLPAADGGLASLATAFHSYRLTSLEWQVWEYTKGTVSLVRIAQQLRLPIEMVQQIAFRLIVLGLAEEVPVPTSQSRSAYVESFRLQLKDTFNKPSISSSLMQSLVEFLRSKPYQD